MSSSPPSYVSLKIIFHLEDDPTLLKIDLI